MELIVTPLNYQHAEKLINFGVNDLHLGIEDFSLKTTAKFSFDEIEQLVCDHPKVKIWVLINKLIHNHEIELLKAVLTKLEQINVTGIVIADLGVLTLVNDGKYDLKVDYDPEHLITNKFALEFYNDKNCNRITMSREINLKQIKEMNQENIYNTVAVVQGSYQILYSKRNLITNYLNHQEPLNKLEKERQVTIYDEERDVYYRVYEDKNGTVLLGADDICMIDEFEDLVDANVKYIKIEGFLKTEEYINNVTKQYLLALALYDVSEDEYFDNCKQLKANVKSYNEKLDLSKGFYYKSSTYITKND